MKELLYGIVLIIIVGVGGLVYRNAVEHPSRPIACPMDARLCPDGTSVGRTGSSCTFPACQYPNISLPDVGISFAVPDGFVSAEVTDTDESVVYRLDTSSSTGASHIIIRRYSTIATSTALDTIQQTAIGGASGVPVSMASFTSRVLGNRRFTVVPIERFEGVIDTAYYLARRTDVLRFDAIDESADWSNPRLDVSTLPAHATIIDLLTTLQGEGN